LSIIPNVSPKTFSASAVIVGYLLIDNLTANEQNALGNWLMLTAQVLCTNAYYKQVSDERKFKADTSISNEEAINMLEEMVKAMQEEINNLK